MELFVLNIYNSNLENLEKELQRLGLNNNPSRLEYTKKRNTETSPAATTVMRELNCSWGELLDLINIPHTKSAIHPNWSGVEDKELLDLIFIFVRNKDIHSLKEYLELRNETVPSQFTINTRFGSWSNVIRAYDEQYDDFRFNYKTVKAFRYEGNLDELINSVAKYIKDNNVSTWSKYNLSKPANLPTQQQLLYRSRMKSEDLTQIIRSKTSGFFSSKGGYKPAKFKNVREAIVASSKFILENQIKTWKQYDLMRTMDLYSFTTLIRKSGSRAELNASLYVLIGIKLPNS